MQCKFYADSNHLDLIQWFRVPDNWPVLPIWNSFGHPSWQGGEYNHDPTDYPGQVGIVNKNVSYSKGGPLPLLFNPTKFCGTIAQWQTGSTYGVDPPLVFTDYLYSNCCLGSDRPFRRGGIKMGGSAQFPQTFQSAGGIRVGYTAFAGEFSSSGGIRVGGAAALPSTFVSTGGIAVGGQASF